MDQSGGGPATGDGVVEGVEGELGAQVGGDGPTDDHPGVAVDDGGEVQEPFLGAQVSDVGDPCLVRRRRGEVTGDDVRRHRRRGVGDGGARPAGPPPGPSDQAMVGHQAGDSVAADPVAAVAELAVHPGRAVAAP
jgi:hypothetical protein